MVRVTAFLRVSFMSAALAATLLAAQVATAAGTAQPGGGPNAGVHTAQGQGGQGHGGQAVSRSGGDKQAGPANAAPLSTAPPSSTPAAGCLKPGVPLCMDDQATFLSADRMSSCQGEVKEYVDRSMTYLTCLNDENIATGRELSRNVDRFNCRLSGRKGCAN
ncbi:hypothetical protein A6A40_03555 [Azospirillum humicireducens]|uniref:Uncharacterized protein n=1 Tax=Azospirillum humicireducens TaxID=1226968 RepID=A0A160JE63_9PROT|nr:hypothetical protein [Azospirillum humicireducens]ANC91050.1 hypothetical protein A6A40_03555 [Azospirillum humicireducens]